MNAAAKQDKELYGIGAVARLTGLTDHTIRVWERRYNAVVAERAPNGRRVYTPADVEKLGLLKRLTDEGLSIGQIAGSSVKELRERARSMGNIGTSPLPDLIRVAVLGDFVTGQLTTCDRNLAPLELLVLDSNPERFAADLLRHEVDVVVLETPVLGADANAQLIEFMQQAGSQHGVIIYGFGRKQDVNAAADAGVVTLRAPVTVDDVRAAILRAYTPAAASKPTAQPEPAEHDWAYSGPIAARRFSQQQLAMLAQASTAIDCECPHHLAQLVSDLSAFEIYSANCANRDEDDAALHAYLHQTTAGARALIEVALEKVAIAEGIRY